MKKINLHPFNKEKAFELISICFDDITNGIKINCFTGEFDAYETIAKGHALLYLSKRNDINKYNKEQFALMIKSV